MLRFGRESFAQPGLAQCIPGPLEICKAHGRDLLREPLDLVHCRFRDGSRMEVIVFATKRNKKAAQLAAVLRYSAAGNCWEDVDFRVRPDCLVDTKRLVRTDCEQDLWPDPSAIHHPFADPRELAIDVRDDLPKCCPGGLNLFQAAGQR